MKSRHKEVSLETLSRLFGNSRQAWYRSRSRAENKATENHIILEFVKEKRKNQSKIGGRKLYHLFSQSEDAARVKIGRDAFFDLLRENGLLIRLRKRYRHPGTNGDGESIYPDFRKSLNVTEINQLWASDITYVRLATQARFCYANFVVDEYSHLIVGHSVTEGMSAEEIRLALENSVQSQLGDREDFGEQLVFHSDRGSQYKSAHFQEFHTKYQIKKSMAERGKSYENPVSERLNGIIKHELLCQESFASFEEAKQSIDRAVEIYNQERPHSSVELLTPQEAHKKGKGPLKKLWKQRKKTKKPTHASQADPLPSKANNRSAPQQIDPAQGPSSTSQRHSDQSVEGNHKLPR